MNPQRLKELTTDRASQDLSQQRHESLLEGQGRVSNAVIDSMVALIKFLQNQTTKTQIVNQLETIGTPDALKVIPEIKALHETLKQHENVDLTDLTAVMRDVFQEVKLIPKTHAEQAAIDIPDYGDKLDTLTEAVNQLAKLIGAQELKVEAPVVNVDAPKVQVDAPDLSPIHDKLAETTKAVKAIAPPVENGAVQTQDISGLITEKFDQFVTTYDDFDDDIAPRVEAVKYLYQGKTVAKLTFTYNSKGDVKSVKKSKR